MSLRDLIATDTTDVLMNTDDFAEVVSFRQGASPAFDITAIRTQTDRETIGVDPALFEDVELVDWQVVVAEFGSVTPRSGGVITQVVNGESWRYEILPMGKRQAVELIDTFGLQYLIHTKRIE